MAEMRLYTRCCHVEALPYRIGSWRCPQCGAEIPDRELSQVLRFDVSLKMDALSEGLGQLRASFEELAERITNGLREAGLLDEAPAAAEVVGPTMSLASPLGSRPPREPPAHSRFPRPCRRPQTSRPDWLAAHRQPPPALRPRYLTGQAPRRH